jgi:non-specific protein-tyrosine kinase
MQDQRISTILWRGKWLIAAAVAVGALLAWVVTAGTAEVYEANAIVQVSSGSTGATNQSPADVQAANQVLAQTYATLIADRSFLASIRPDVEGGRVSTADLQSAISAKAVTNTALVSLTAEGSSPEEARRLADGVAGAFVAYVADSAQATSQKQQSKLRDQITLMSRKIRALQAGPQTPNATQQLDSLRIARTALETQLSNMIASGIEQGSSVRVSAPATASSAPVRPRPLLNELAGILLGFLAGVLLSWVRVRLDRGLHTSQEAEELLQAPVLASVPVRRRFSTEDPVLGESFDVLRANLAFISLDRPLSVLTFTSFNPGEGKSSTVEGLAYAAGRSGLSAIVVDADVRTRRLSQRTGFGAAPGLTSVVVGAAELEDVIVELAPGVSLLPAGPTPPNPPSLLGAGRARELIDELRTRYALVLVDSPPVAHLADGSILASVSDGVVVVARVGVTNRSDVVETAASLRHIPTPIVGSVLLEPRTVDETYYPALARGPRAAVTEPAQSG